MLLLRGYKSSFVCDLMCVQVQYILQQRDGSTEPAATPFRDCEAVLENNKALYVREVSVV